MWTKTLFLNTSCLFKEAFIEKVVVIILAPHVFIKKLKNKVF